MNARVDRSGLRRRVLGPFALIALMGTFCGIYFATQLRFAYPSPFRAPWREALTVNLVFYYLWAAAVPWILALERRFPLESGRRLKSLSAHAIASVFTTAAQLSIGNLFLRMLGFHTSLPLGASFVRSLQLNFHSSLPTYWLILFACSAWDYYRKYRDREVRASQLETELADAQLAALRAQLNPHFLFNTLNSISSLMYSDVEAADRMMTRLSDLLRLTLEKDSTQELPLREEMDIVLRYLDIERIRFEDRLDIAVDVGEDVMTARVPAFSLQPIVENALRHAIEPQQGGGKLKIRAWRDGERLRIAISDNGPGLRGQASSRQGIGLANTRARLARLYGDRQTLSLQPLPAGGLKVEVSIPYRPATDRPTAVH